MAHKEAPTWVKQVSATSKQWALQRFVTIDHDMQAEDGIGGAAHGPDAHKFHCWCVQGLWVAVFVVPVSRYITFFACCLSPSRPVGLSACHGQNLRVQNNAPAR